MVDGSYPGSDDSGASGVVLDVSIGVIRSAANVNPAHEATESGRRGRRSRRHWSVPFPPRRVSMVLCTSLGEVLGQLPVFEVPGPDWRDSREPRSHVATSYGLDVTILRLLDAAAPEPPGGPVTYLAQVSGDVPAGLPLAPYLGRVDDHPLRPPYARPGGPARDLRWASGVLDRHGLRQTGPAEQIRTWNLSSVWRIPLEDRGAWLKCVPPFFAHEGALMSRLAGGPVPIVLGHEPGRLLLDEAAGRDLHDAGPGRLRELVTALVEVQERWSGRLVELAELGLPDWRPEPLTAQIESLVARVAGTIPAEDGRAIDRLLEGLGRRWSAIEECGIPETLVHGDFWPGNAMGDDGTFVLLDWGDSGIGHPLLDQTSFLDRITRSVVADIRSHWADAWRRVVPGSDPDRAAGLLAPVAAARQAVVYQGFLDRIEPSEHPYHRTDPAIWLRQAAALVREEPASRGA